MSKIKNLIRMVSLVICLSLIFSAPGQILADSTESAENDHADTMYGRLLVYLLEGEGSQVALDVLVKDGFLYVRSSSFAKGFGYITAETDDSVQFLQTVNEEDEDYSWTLLSNFKINSKAVWLSDGNQVINYTAPVKTEKNEDGTWIPLQFALKIMGRELCINGNTILISSAHESTEMLIDSVNRAESSYFNVVVVTNQLMEKMGLETNVSPLYTEALAAEADKNEWVYSYADRTKETAGHNSEATSELATYLVSNLGAENSAIYSAYYELIQMYFGTELLGVGADLVDSLRKWEDEEAPDFSNAEKEFEAAVDAMCETNPDNMQMSDSFNRIYSDLIGYDPKSKEWTGDTVYEELLLAMITYSGDPDETVYETIDFAGSYLGSAGIASPMFAAEYANIQCMKNAFAKNDYAGSRFEKYLSQVTSHPGKAKLVDALNEKIANYFKYQTDLIDEYMGRAEDEIEESIRSDVLDDLEENFLKDGVIEIKPILKTGYDKVTTVADLFTNVTDLIDDVNEYQKKIEQIAENELLADSGAYYTAKTFADEIAGHAIKDRDIDWVYLFYRTEYIANYYYSQVLEKTQTKKSASADDVAALKKALTSLKKEDLYQLASIRMGIEYGLSPEDNTEYNNLYEDTPLLDYVEEINLSMGNSSANINACGFIAASDEHFFYASSDENYSVYMSDLNGKSEKKIINGWAHWLNTFIEDGQEYLFYIDSEYDIRRYNVETDSDERVSSGTYSNMMLAEGNIFVQENGNLYRIPIINAASYGEKELFISGIGNTVVYDEENVYYSDSDGEICCIDYAGENVEELNIFSTSFDISNGNLYYSNDKDDRSIYLYDTRMGITSKLSEVTDTYCISYYQGMVYYKVDDDRHSGLVYSVVPFVDLPIVRVYSWNGTDAWWVGIEDDESSGRDTRRLYNIANGKIYNEGYTWDLWGAPVSGVTLQTAFNFIIYQISSLWDSE